MGVPNASATRCSPPRARLPSPPMSISGCGTSSALIAPFMGTQIVSDWAVRHSTSGWVFMHGPAAISWLTKQPTVALSFCEAEIVAAFEATKEAVPPRTLFEELGLPQRQPTSLSRDKKSAIDLAHNPEIISA
eukprot:1241896-Pleurochrysis_carterae.AAC.2